MSLLLSIDPNARTPIWRQVTDRVVRLVDEGTLLPGDRLPPTRVLARELGVNRSTVCRAYEELWALGYVESRQGSYSTVRGRARALTSGARVERSLVNWDRVTAPGPRAALRDLAAAPLPPDAGPGFIDFGSLTADPDLCPADDFRRAIRHVLLEDGRRLLDYGDPAGFRPLRETLARRLRTHGVSVSADELLLTQGAQQALDLVLRLLCRAGASVVVEAPTYGLVLPLLRSAGLRPLEVPMTADGMDLDVLEQRLRRTRPALLYTVPTFHNPTGVTTDQAHRERLLAICEARRVPILEDGFEEDMKYFGRAVLPIKSMDVHGLVLYVGTLSKVVFPGLRIGWIAAEPEAICRLAALKRFSNLSDSPVLQAAVERFCRSGRYDAYLRRLHATFRRRMVAMLKGLARHLPPGSLEWTEPTGGCTLWARVAGAQRADEARLLDCAREEQVSVTPGSLFFATPPDALYLRLSIAKTKAHAIDEGCRRLARAVAHLAARRP